MAVFTVQEIAADLKVDPNTVYRWIYDGKLKAFKVGGAVRVEEKDLNEFKKLRGGESRGNGKDEDETGIQPGAS